MGECEDFVEHDYALAKAWRDYECRSFGVCESVVDGFCGDCGGFACLSSHASDYSWCWVVKELFLVAERFEIEDELGEE